MDAAALGWFERPCRLVDVCRPATRERRDHRPVHFTRHLPGGFRVGGRRDRKSRLDDVHSECLERPGHGELRRYIHRETGGLLTVAQRGVEDDDASGFTHDEQL